MTAIIHFGMPKTGSTSIQSTLTRLKDESAAGFAYVTGDGRSINGNKTSKILCRTEERSSYIVETQSWVGKNEDFSKRESDVRNALIAEIESAKDRKIIFSSEDVLLSNEERLTRFRELFLAAGPAVRAIAYVRTPKSFMESSFQQRVKSGASRFSMDRLYPEYRRRFEKFDRVFGRENVELGFFDPKSLLNGCVVQDFCHKAGLDVPAEMVVRRNDALSRQALALLYTYRKFGVLYSGGRNARGEAPALIGRIRDLGGLKVRFHSSLVAPVLEEYRDDVAWMEDRLGVSLTEGLEADDATAIKSEADLFEYEPDTLRWLSDLLEDDPLAQKVLSGEPAIVAQGLHAAYKDGRERAERRRVRSGKAAPAKDEVLPAKYLAKAALRLGAASAELTTEQAETLLSAALAQIKARMADKGVVVEGLGGFYAADKTQDDSASNVYVFESANGNTR